MLGEINKLLGAVHDDEDAFVQRSMEQSAASHLDEVKKAKRLLSKNERRIEELGFISCADLNAVEPVQYQYIEKPKKCLPYTDIAVM